MEKLRGLSVYVYKPSAWMKSGTDCTAGGITSKVDNIILVDPTNCIGPFEVEENEVYLVVVRRNFWGKEYIHAEPYQNGKRLNPGKLCMAGGNYVDTSDSRFPNLYPIGVHDRFESQETYDALSQ